jgi:hypothetical protein
MGTSATAKVGTADPRHRRKKRRARRGTALQISSIGAIRMKRQADPDLSPKVLSRL